MEKLAEEIRLSKEYFLKLIDSLTPGVIGLSINGEITHFNHSFRMMFDLPELKVEEKFFHSFPGFDDS